MKPISLTIALMLCASTAAAQGSVHQPRPTSPHARPGVHHREALEQQFRQRSEQIVRQRLKLNDDQVNRLRSVNAQIGTQRNELFEQERSVRADLRDEMAKGSSADQDRVSQLMARAHDLQSKRFALQQTEQQQLSGFLTPVQVAQYVGLQAQLRQHIREMQRGRPSGGSGSGDPHTPNP